jgi:hypothetical protein
MIDKRERFEKVAQNRVQAILNTLSLLGNCSNRNNYSYSEEDVRKMMDAIKQSLKETEMRFMSEVRKSGNKKFNF